MTAVFLYHVLRDEDGAVYDNMRFNPKNLLKVDGPVARYIGYVNRCRLRTHRASRVAQRKDPVHWRLRRP